ncbi:uncharacterized protein LOC135125710 [Zophobas morio]|uniref:uncharacterized protein LOC135125710 n=1 Tax=Zophobas morio TaxID=2755281 RepID=UPI003083D586
MKVGKIKVLENKMEKMEKENKKNNVIITGMEINNNNEEEIITKAEEIIKHLKVEAKIKKTKRIKGTMCVIEMETFQQKLKVMEHKWKLSNIQSGKIFITSDLTERERQIQKEIKEIRDEEKKKNSNVKMGYQRLFVGGKKYIWNKEKKCLEDNTAAYGPNENEKKRSKRQILGGPNNCYRGQHGRNIGSRRSQCVGRVGIRKNETEFVLGRHDVKVMRGAEIDSDHFLLVGEIKQLNKDGNEGKDDYRAEQQEILKAYRLQEQKVAEKYEEASNREIQKRQDNMKSMSILQMWQEIKRTITTAVRDVCGVSKMNRQNRRTAWWCEEIQNQIEMKKKRWKGYLTKRLEEKYNKYKQQRNIVKNMVKEAKNKSWQEFGEKLETNQPESFL